MARRTTLFSFPCEIMSAYAPPEIRGNFMIARLIVILSLAMLVHIGPAAAHGFCDDIQPPPRGLPAGINVPTGGHCHQTRATFLQDGVVMPDASSISLVPYMTSAPIPIGFIVAVDKLHLPARPGGSFAEVFELDIAHTMDNGSCCGDTRALSMQVLRLANGNAAFQWDWHAALPSPQDATVLMPAPATTDLVVVNITPSADWSRFDVDVQSIDLQQSKILSDQSATFSMSVPSNLRNVPVSMRSGVIDGDLYAPGMQTAYWFLSPALE